MSELHVLMPDGQQSVCTEDQVNDLLEQGIITLETYYWQEGMEEWRPLLDLADAPAAAPTDEEIAEVPFADSAEDVFEAPLETPFAAPTKTPDHVPSATRSEAPSTTLSETSVSVPTFVPPRRTIDPSLPVPLRPPIVKATSVKTEAESEKNSPISPPEEIPPSTKNFTETKISDTLPAPSLPKKTLQPALPAQQLEFTDAPPAISSAKEGDEVAAPITPHQPIIAEPAIRFEEIESTPRPVDASPKKYEFRRNPLLLTISLQVLMVLSLLATAFYLFQCYEQVYGGDDSTALLMGTGSSGDAVKGISDSDTTYFLEFIWILVGVHILIESLFFCWVYLANFNCRGFISNMTYTPGWAVGYFFIPFLNLFRPYQVMQEIWKVSENPQGWLGKRNSIFVGFWFLCRLAIIVIGHGPFQTIYSNNPDPHVRMLGTLCYLMVVESIVFFIQATTLVLISIVTARQIKLTK